MAPPSGADDVLRRRPGFNPLPDGSTGLDPSYLAPRREAQRRSGWGSRVVLDTRESGGLPQDGGGNFAGVDLGKNGAGDYGLDPHYAAQLRAALDAPPMFRPSANRSFAAASSVREQRHSGSPGRVR